MTTGPGDAPPGMPAHLWALAKRDARGALPDRLRAARDNGDDAPSRIRRIARTAAGVGATFGLGSVIGAVSGLLGGNGVATAEPTVLAGPTGVRAQPAGAGAGGGPGDAGAPGAGAALAGGPGGGGRVDVVGGAPLDVVTTGGDGRPGFAAPGDGAPGYGSSEAGPGDDGGLDGPGVLGGARATTTGPSDGGPVGQGMGTAFRVSDGDPATDDVLTVEIFQDVAVTETADGFFVVDAFQVVVIRDGDGQEFVFKEHFQATVPDPPGQETDLVIHETGRVQVVENADGSFTPVTTDFGIAVTVGADGDGRDEVTITQTETVSLVDREAVPDDDVDVILSSRATSVSDDVGDEARSVVTQEQAVLDGDVAAGVVAVGAVGTVTVPPGNGVGVDGRTTASTAPGFVPVAPAASVSAATAARPDPVVLGAAVGAAPVAAAAAIGAVDGAGADGVDAVPDAVSDATPDTAPAAAPTDVAEGGAEAAVVTDAGPDAGGDPLTDAAATPDPFAEAPTSTTRPFLPADDQQQADPFGDEPAQADAFTGAADAPSDPFSDGRDAPTGTDRPADGDAAATDVAPDDTAASSTDTARTPGASDGADGADSGAAPDSDSDGADAASDSAPDRGGGDGGSGGDQPDQSTDASSGDAALAS